MAEYRQRLKEDAERYEAYLLQQRTRMEEARKRKRVRIMGGIKGTVQ
jgi:hypothetical protein